MITIKSVEVGVGFYAVTFSDNASLKVNTPIGKEQKFADEYKKDYEQLVVQK